MKIFPDFTFIGVLVCLSKMTELFYGNINLSLFCIYLFSLQSYLNEPEVSRLL